MNSAQMIETGFNEFLAHREEAASAYVRGDGSMLDQIIPRQGNVSFHSPSGDSLSGAESVAKRYLEDAALFHGGGLSHLETLQKGSDGDLGFWTGFQVANVQIGDMPKPIDMRIRVTEIYRRLAGEWKLIHRHADAPAAK